MSLEKDETLTTFSQKAKPEVEKLILELRGWSIVNVQKNNTPVNLLIIVFRQKTNSKLSFEFCRKPVNVQNVEGYSTACLQEDKTHADFCGQ